MLGEPISEEAYPTRAPLEPIFLSRHLGHIKDPPAWCPRERAWLCPLGKRPKLPKHILFRSYSLLVPTTFPGIVQLWDRNQRPWFSIESRGGRRERVQCSGTHLTCLLGTEMGGGACR